VGRYCSIRCCNANKCKVDNLKISNVGVAKLAGLRSEGIDSAHRGEVSREVCECDRASSRLAAFWTSQGDLVVLVRPMISPTGPGYSSARH
jgi:hypothetical protein